MVRPIFGLGCQSVATRGKKDLEVLGMSKSGNSDIGKHGLFRSRRLWAAAWIT